MLYMPDTAIRGRILNGCWLSAAAGTAVVQMLLLAQAWHLYQQATPVACVASAWLVGALIGNVANDALRRFPALPKIVWGGAFLGCAAGWRTWARASGYPGVPFSVTASLARLLPLLGTALLLGFFSALWLFQQRGWASVAERAVLARNTVCLTFGLVIVWCSPGWSELVGLLALLPLLALDLLTAAINPRASWGGLAGMLLRQQADPARWSSLRLQGRGSVAGWWKAYLAHRGSALPTLLGIGTAILVGAVWGAVPTPFAGGLAATGELDKLIWLLAGQIGALALLLWLFSRNRGLVGAPDRLIPPHLRARAWRLAWFSLSLAACSLVLLGLPPLQAPWWLALSLGLYALAATGWGVLLPRLRPSITTEVFAQRHQALGQGVALRSGYLAYEQAVENRFSLVSGTVEGLVTAFVVPIAGLLIDHTTVDKTLIFMGLGLAWFLVIVLAANVVRSTRAIAGGPGRTKKVKGLSFYRLERLKQ